MARRGRSRRRRPASRPLTRRLGRVRRPGLVHENQLDRVAASVADVKRSVSPRPTRSRAPPGEGRADSGRATLLRRSVLIVVAVGVVRSALRWPELAFSALRAIHDRYKRWLRIVGVFGVESAPPVRLNPCDAPAFLAHEHTALLPRLRPALTRSQHGSPKDYDATITSPEDKTQRAKEGTKVGLLRRPGSSVTASDRL